MNICILSKFPPMEGGISAKSYWLARGYARAGMSVHVVSNGNTTEDEYKIKGCFLDEKTMKGIVLHEVEKSLPWHIPEEPHSLVKLIEKTLEVHQKYPLDVIDTGYLIPYGIAGYIVNEITGIPYILRHGGSDLEKFLKPGLFSRILELVLKNASKIITDESHETLFAPHKEKVVFVPPYVPNGEIFSPVFRKINPFPILLYVGKINWYWQRKGLDIIVKCIPLLPKGWKLNILGQGKGKKNLSEFITKIVNKELQIQPFIHPEKVPQLLQNADYVFCLSVDEPIQTISNTLLEAIFCGTTVIVNDTFDSSLYDTLVDNIDSFILRVPLSKPQELVQSIELHWRNKNHQIMGNSPMCYSYDDYIEMNLKILEKSVQ